MKRTRIEDIRENVGKHVLLKGWIHEIRDQSKLKFILIRDITGIAQAIVKEGQELFDLVPKISKESVVELEGLVKEEKQAPGGIEVVVERLEVISKPEDRLPIQVIEKTSDEASLPKRLDYRWIDLRKPKNALIFKVWTKMEAAMREYWLNSGFIEIHSPKLMETATESGSELFALPYFDRTAFLAQSPQFYKQMAMAAGFEKVFEVGPVFRANPSHTTRHDTEFTSVDVEISFIDSHEDVMAFEEGWLKFIVENVKEKFGKEIKEVFGKTVVLPTIPFPRITLNEAKKLLEEKGQASREEDLSTEEERFLSEIIMEKYGHEFVFVKDYPVSVRPFYHMRHEGDPSLTKSFDLLWNGIEITTGAQREHRYEILKKQAIEKKVDLGLIEDYLNFFKYGCPPHGGFGLSPTRLLMSILGIKNVREVTFVPRDPERLRP